MKHLTSSIMILMSGLGACGDDAAGGTDAAETATTTASDSATPSDTVTTATRDVVGPGTGLGDAYDGDGEVAEPRPNPWSGTSGSIEIIEHYSGGAGEVGRGDVLVQLYDGILPTRLRPVIGQGDCTLYAEGEFPCPGGCSAADFCDANSECVRFPEPVSAGVVTLTGLVTSFTATPESPTPAYVVTPDPPTGGLFAAGAAVAVEAAGAGSYPAFTVGVRGVADQALGTIGLVELVDDEPFELTWTPAGDGSTVELVLQLGWHGGPPSARIVCATDDSAGKLTVYPGVVNVFPYFQVGLFQVPSWIDRLSRVMLEGPFGPIEVKVASRVNLGVTHVSKRAPD